MSPRVVDKEQKKREIIRAAFEVFARQGVFNFKMIDIAENAGIGKGTLYEYFSSKEELISACFDLHMEKYGQALRNKIEPLSEPKEKLKAVIELTFEYFIAHKGILSTMFDFWALSIQSKGEESAFADFGEMYKTYTEFLASILEEGIKIGQFRPLDAEFVASTIIAILDGMMFQAVLGVIDINDKQIPEKLNRALLEGILK